jgi:L-lactate utilization protein LutB
MDKNTAFVVEKKVERTIKNLEKNNMNGYFVQNNEEALNKIKELLNEGDMVSVGGSMTLFEIGALELLRNGKYNFLDRYEEGLTKEQIKDIYRKSFCADAYLSSSNAVTEEGELYNVDGNGNRVAAMIYGPDKVIIVVGTNKIVKDLDEAVMRNREIAAPANAKRLNRTTPCAKVGYCMDCSSKDRICSDYVVIRRQMQNGRIHIIVVNEELGY